MNELQIGLVGMGVVAVVGVATYNTWQEYRHRKLAERILNERHADVLLDTSEASNAESATEPGFFGQETNYEYSSDEPLVENQTRATAQLADTDNKPAPDIHERIEPVFSFDAAPEEPRLARRQIDDESDVTPAWSPEPETIPEAVHAPVAASMPDDEKYNMDVAEPLHLLSPAIDYVASFEAVESAPAYQILESQNEVLARLHKPVRWIGYNERSREWEEIVDEGDSEYRRIRVGLQLVDRQGPLRDGDLSVFHIAMHDLADELMAIVDLPNKQTALENAAKLDEFCAIVDIQIGINVISQAQEFPGTKLRALAEAAGMVIDNEGRFVRCDDDGQVLYVVLNQETSGFSVESMKTMTTHGITFLLDVPRVAHGERVFNQMVDLARRFADVLRGTLVDDNRRPLSDAGLEPIRRHIGHCQSIMATQNMPAGGVLAQRLFS